MSPRDTKVRGDTLIQVGSARAVLIDDVPDEAAARTAAAEARLREATGRNDIVITRRPSGRPRLAPPFPELAVSMSHRGGLLLVGFSPSKRVGVDLELDDASLDAKRLAVDHFSAGEAEQIALMGAVSARSAFLRLWTAKEALLKLTGRGVFDGMGQPDLSSRLRELSHDGCEVSLVEAIPAAILLIRRIERLPLPTAYCALAVELS